MVTGAFGINLDAGPRASPSWTATAWAPVLHLCERCVALLPLFFWQSNLHAWLSAWLALSLRLLVVVVQEGATAAPPAPTLFARLRPVLLLATPRARLAFAALACAEAFVCGTLVLSAVAVLAACVVRRPPARAPPRRAAAARSARNSAQFADARFLPPNRRCARAACGRTHAAGAALLLLGAAALAFGDGRLPQVAAPLAAAVGAALAAVEARHAAAADGIGGGGGGGGGECTPSHIAVSALGGAAFGWYADPADGAGISLLLAAAALLPYARDAGTADGFRYAPLTRRQTAEKLLDLELDMGDDDDDDDPSPRGY